MTASPAMSAQGNPRVKKRWLAYFGVNSLALSILLHVLFGLGATFLIVEHFQKHHVNFHATEPPAQHTEIEHKVELAKRNSEESAPPDLKRIVSTDVAAITLPDPPEVPTTDEPDPTPMAAVDGVMGSAISDANGNGGFGNGGGGGGGGGGGAMTPFGASDGPGMQGNFYDLKQTSDKQSTGMTKDLYYQILGKYVAQGWDDSLLQPYYQSKNPRYADRLAISTRGSEEAPKAFGVEKEVQPGLWCVHYHARVVAPQEGSYRLAGFGDNVLLVKIDGVTVLDAGFTFLTNKAPLHQYLSYVFPSYIGNSMTDPHLRVGPTFHMGTDPVDMDVLIGDDGGVCSFFLLIQNMGNTYDTAPDGTPKLPVFQLGDKSAPKFLDSEEHPPISTTPEPWQKVSDDDGQ